MSPLTEKLRRRGRTLGAAAALALCSASLGAAATPASAATAPTIVHAFPSNRTTTSVRLNAWITAGGAATSFYFQYGTGEGYGTNLPASKNKSAGSSTEPELFSLEPSGLAPGTTYHYRVIAKNSGGETVGSDQVFTTRVPAEIEWPPRVPELVNPPEKGNVDVQYVSVGTGLAIPVPADGNSILWTNAASGPDAVSGSWPTYKSTYTPEGWATKAMTPGPGQLPGGGDLYTRVMAVTPDLSTYVFMMDMGADITPYPDQLRGVVLRNAQGGVEVIDPLSPREYVNANRPIISNDGRQVVYLTREPQQLIDFHDGENHLLPTPACGFESPPDGYQWIAPADASRIFISSSGDEECALPKGVFMVDRETGESTLISGPQSTEAEFLRSNADGSVVIYEKGENLYRWSEAGGDECLTCSVPGGVAHVSPAQVVVSEDLSHAYFVSSAGIGPGYPAGVYVWHHGDRVDFVAGGTESSFSDRPDGSGISAEVTPSGNVLVFLANGATSDQGNGGSQGKHFAYRYEDSSGTLDCVSCRNGALTVGGVFGFFGGHIFSVSADGQTVAFTSEAALLPQDINGVPDVYEWHNGLLRLVSDGVSETASNLESSAVPSVWGLSADGRSLFYSIGGVKVTGNEADPDVNLYDARAGGSGFPPSAPPAHCSEDSCQGPLQSPPALQSPGSASLLSPGDRARHRHRHHRHRHRTRHHRRHPRGRAQSKQGGGK